MRIDIWSDIACPWCWIGKHRFQTALDAFAHKDEVDVHWHSYQLDPTLPESYDGTELDYLVQRKGASAAQIEQMFTHVAGQAAEVGLTMNFDTIAVANSLRAHRLLHLAGEQGRYEAVQERLFEAHFRDGRVISDPEVLVDLATAAGLDADEARAAIDSSTLEAAVRDDIALGGQIGVQGVPFFVLDERYGVSGAQPPEVFASVLDEVWAETHTVTPVTPLVSSGATGEACGPDGC